VSQLRILVRDAVITSFSGSLYGTDIVLSNGIEVQVTDGDFSAKADLSNGDPILSNTDWQKFADPKFSTYSLGDRSTVFVWNFAAAGAPLILNGANEDRLVVLLEDNFTGLVDHTFTAQGYWIMEAL